MEFVEYLKEEYYQVANLRGDGKCPGIKEWNTLPNLYDKCHIKEGEKYFIRTGEQLNMEEGCNEDYILGLDFDVYKKGCKNNQHQKTLAQLEAFKQSNPDNAGMFKSATAFNEGCLVSIRKCVEIIEMLYEIGSTRFSNKGDNLEILYGSAMTIPPSKTKCKMTGRDTGREFYDIEQPILQLERNTPQYKFILSYIKKYWTKKHSGLSTNDKKRLNKKQKEIYSQWSNGKYAEEMKTNPIHGVNLLSKLSPKRYEYNNWWKIGTALLNSFSKEVATKLFVGWSKQGENFVSEEDVIEKLEAFDKIRERYTGLTICTIFRWIECDNKNAFLPCIEEYKKIANDTMKQSYKETFEAEYKFCKNPQGYFHKTKDNEWILKKSYEIGELEAHNSELLDEWRKNPKRKIFEWADCIPMKQANDQNDNWLNLFSGFKFWEWGEIEDWEEEWAKKYQHYQNIENSLAYMIEEWWKIYMDVISAGDPKIARYLKCLIARGLLHPSTPSKVMVCFSGKEGAGKSFIKNLHDSFIGGRTVHSEVNPASGNSVFGSFQEPLLYATQVFLEENDPKKLNAVINELKEAITRDRCSVNTKNKCLIHRKSCIQYWGITNDFSTIDFTTTVRRFLAIKVKPNLIKGLIDKLDKQWQEKYGWTFWDFGHDMVLKNEFCLKYILLDIREEYEDAGGEYIDFQKTMPECDHMKAAVKRNIKPIYPFLQKICEDAIEKMKDYQFEKEENEYDKSFETWFYKDNNYGHDSRVLLKPLSNYYAEAKGFVGGWKIRNKEFREELNKYIRDVLDLGHGSWETKNISQYLTDLLGTNGEYLLSEKVGDLMCYIIKPNKTIEILKTFNYYQQEFTTSSDEVIEEIFEWETERLAEAKAKQKTKNSQ